MTDIDELLQNVYRARSAQTKADFEYQRARTALVKAMDEAGLRRVRGQFFSARLSLETRQVVRADDVIRTLREEGREDLIASLVEENDYFLLRVRVNDDEE